MLWMALSLLVVSMKYTSRRIQGFGICAHVRSLEIYNTGYLDHPDITRATLGPLIIGLEPGLEAFRGGLHTSVHGQILTSYV